MKVVLLLSLCTAASAFVTAPSRPLTLVSSSALNAASTPDGLNGWSEKPRYVAESTTPVAARKVSKSERMRMKDVVIPPNFFLSWAVLLLGPLIMWYHPCKHPCCWFVGLSDCDVDRSSWLRLAVIRVVLTVASFHWPVFCIVVGALSISLHGRW